MNYKFKDVEFLTAKEKELILKAWIKFLDNGLKEQHFSKRLYDHCLLHCDFIAHYNIGGFYSTYFNGDYSDLKRFFSHFTTGNGYVYIVDYRDISTAMIKEYEKRKKEIFRKAQETADDRFEVLKECVKRAETDLEFRENFLHKIGN